MLLENYRNFRSATYQICTSYMNVIVLCLIQSRDFRIDCSIWKYDRESNFRTSSYILAICRRKN